jgi:hypothetical protein
MTGFDTAAASTTANNRLQRTALCAAAEPERYVTNLGKEKRMAIGPDEIHNLIEQLQPVRDRAADDKMAVAGHYPFASPDHDARITAFAKLINVLNSVQLAFMFASQHLLYKPDIITI